MDPDPSIQPNIPRSQLAASLAAYIPMDRRFALAEGRALPDRTRGAALFADVTGFTQVSVVLAQELGSQRGAEELTGHLNRIFGALIAEVHRYHGSIVSFAGDAITCWFDRSAAGGDERGSTRLALTCALMMQATMRHMEAITTPSRTVLPLTVKIAVTAGEVHRFQVSDNSGESQSASLGHQTDTLAGSLLDRLTADQVAHPGEVVVDQTTLELLGHEILFSRDGDRRFWRTGAGSRIFAAAVTGLKQPADPTPWPPAPELSPEMAGQWMPRPVFQRLERGEGEFLSELRLACSLFLRFDGIDYDNDPQSGEKLDRYVSWVGSVVNKHNGHLIKLTIGDKGCYFQAAFGVLQAFEDDAALCTAAAIELLSPPADLSFIHSIQIGLSRGQARSGAYGSPTRRTYGVHGRQVNIAARLMMLANPETDPELSILLALEGLSARHTVEAESTLHQAIVTSPVRQTFFSNGMQGWMAASPDGRIIYASGAGGGTAWDTTTGELLYSHRLPEGDWINRTDFSPDGALLLLNYETYNDAGENRPGEVALVDANTGEEVVRFVAHDAWMQSTQFSPDGNLFATASGDLTVKVWDLAATLETGTGQLVATFCCTNTWNNNVEFSPDSERLAINMSEGELVIWDIASDERLHTLESNFNFKSRYSPDGRYLVTAGLDGIIEVWDAGTGEKLSETLSHSGNNVFDVQFNGDGTQLASVGADGSIRLWRFSPDGLEEIRKLPSHSRYVGGAAFSPDGQFLYTSSQETRIWDISPAGSAEVAAIKAHAGEIRDFNLLNDGAQLLTVGDDGMLRLWDTDSWQEIRAMQAHEGIISEVDVSPDGRMIATASRNDITPKVWDADTWEQLFSLEGHVSELQDTGFVSQGVWAVQFSPDGQRLTTAADDHTARIWDVTNGDLLLTLSGHGKDDYADLVDGDMVTRILFSPDGKLVATAGGDGTVRVWDAADGQMLLTLVGDPEEARHFSLAFSPDGRRLAAGGWSHTIEMWQLPDDPWSATDEDVAPLYQIPTGAGRLEQIRFSTNGERIVVVGSTGLAEIRDTDTGELLIGLQHPAGVSYAEFTPDGKRLMTGGQDGIFRIWALDLQELVTLARSRVTRELTDEECQQYLHRDACQNEE